MSIYYSVRNPIKIHLFKRWHFMMILFFMGRIFNLNAQEDKLEICVFPFVESAFEVGKISREEVSSDYLFLKKEETLYQRLLSFVYNAEVESMEINRVQPDQLTNYDSLFRSITSINKFNEVYVSAILTPTLKQEIVGLKETSGVDYILTINFYSITVNKTYDNTIDFIEHAIHYDLYDSNLEPVYGGEFIGSSNDFYSSSMQKVFNDFLRDTKFRVSILKEANDKNSFDMMYQEKYKRYNNKIYGLKGSWGVGLTGGLNTIYGGLGLHVLHFVSNDLELNTGLGYDFGGFKMGGGLRYFIFSDYTTKNKIFVTLNYGFNSGNTFELGGQRDENGYQLYPDDVSVHKIYFDHSVHLGTGINFISDITASEKIVFQPFIGYSFSFINRDTELLSGKDVNFRNNFTEFMGSGGIHFGINITGYFKSKKKK